MRKKILISALILLALPALAAVKSFNAGAGLVRGQPDIAAGKILGYFVWADGDSFHLRWCTDSKPYLFTGRIDTDKPVAELSAVREESGGWARLHGNRIVMFSKTSRGDVDGLDLKIPEGRIVQLELQIDGEAVAPEQVFLGKAGTNPRGLPLKIFTR